MRYSFRPLGGAFLFITHPVLAQDGEFESCIRKLADRDQAGKTAFQEAVSKGLKDSRRE